MSASHPGTLSHREDVQKICVPDAFDITQRASNSDLAKKTSLLLHSSVVFEELAVLASAFIPIIAAMCFTSSTDKFWRFFFKRRRRASSSGLYDLPYESFIPKCSSPEINNYIRTTLRFLPVEQSFLNSFRKAFKLSRAALRSARMRSNVASISGTPVRRGCFFGVASP